MRRVETGKLTFLAILYLLGLIVSAPTLHIQRIFETVLPKDYGRAIHKGLDLEGGLDITYQVSLTKTQLATGTVAPEFVQVLHTTKEVVTDRIDMLGVVNALVQIQGDDQLRIQIPGLDERRQKQVKEIIGQTYLLQFNEVVDDSATIAGLSPGPDDTIIQGVEEKDEKGKTRPGHFYLVKKIPELTGEYISDARVSYNEFGKSEIHFEATPEGGDKFGEITRRLLNKRLAIVLGGKVYMAPVIQGEFTTSARITGNFDVEEAKRIVNIFVAGSLPSELTVLAENVVGPTLGADSVHKGLYASLWGAALVLVFMVLRYRLSGVMADITLLLNLLLQLTMLVWLDATLTLPGIAGFALTVGMAVDSNVLVFERMREEWRAGKTVRAAIDAGYAKAFWAIFDSHVTTMLTAVILFYFGSGPIAGFAVTLFIGLAVNLFTSLAATRWFQDNYYAITGVTTLSV